MNPFDFSPLFSLAHGFSPVMAVGAFFPFFNKENEATGNVKGAPAENHEQENHYLSPRQTLNDMQVEEISMGEFDEFLQALPATKKRINNHDQQQ